MTVCLPVAIKKKKPPPPLPLDQIISFP
jgi:hypothetical protein